MITLVLISTVITRAIVSLHCCDMTEIGLPTVFVKALTLPFGASRNRFIALKINDFSSSQRASNSSLKLFGILELPTAISWPLHRTGEHGPYGLLNMQFLEGRFYGRPIYN